MSVQDGGERGKLATFLIELLQVDIAGFMIK